MFSFSVLKLQTNQRICDVNSNFGIPKTVKHYRLETVTSIHVTIPQNSP